MFMSLFYVYVIGREQKAKVIRSVELAKKQALPKRIGFFFFACQTVGVICLQLNN